MITVTCHCGNVNLTFKQLPSFVRDCDCPICNRLGALWADFAAEDVTVRTDRSTEVYRWGDNDYQMHHCSTCGCTTHYSSFETNQRSELGINLRMLDRAQLDTIPVRR